jgi:hypothetical protein
MNHDDYITVDEKKPEDENLVTFSWHCLFKLYKSFS